MKKVDELFKATAASLWETMTSHSGTAGFRIPEYQRSYNWNEEKIARLLGDSANGLYFLTTSDESFTFLGTMILVTEKTKETTFDGNSLAIVDGQQRITTLILTFCALIEAINEQLHIVEHLPSEQKKWLLQEANFQLDELYRCAVGQLTGRGKSYPFPRLVRSEDARAREPKDTEYQSIVSRFLKEFSRYYEESRANFEFPKLEDSREVSLFRKNFDFIRQQIRILSAATGEESELDCEIISPSDFNRKGIKRLFEKLETFETGSEQDKVLSAIGNGTEADAVVRLILFASYMMRCVVLTRVETDDENSAFDIFDALNTTGEPLTAIETLKPRVIQYEGKKGYGYGGSESELAFKRIDDCLDERFKNPDERQKETKELIVSYALYVDGTKQPKDLSSQRKYLRTCLSDIEKKADIKLARRFVSGLGDLAYFRQHYWDRDGIATLGGLHPSPCLEQMQLCLRFLRDLNTSLAIPPIARFWSKFYQDENNEEEFLNALRALTAFVVLRRAATGSTANIDSDLRALMSKPSLKGSRPLCVGLTQMNTITTLVEFKSVLRHYLARSAVRVIDKASWVSRVNENPLAQQSKPLTRFLLLSAAEQSRPDEDKPGLWSRKDVIRTDERSYLTYSNWIADKYSTIEHIAPESRPPSGWDESIYLRPYTRQILGNLTLLPKEENSSVGNAGWQKKKNFYLALMESDKSMQEKYIETARAEGFPFSKRFEELLDSGERLHLLDPLYHVKSWDEGIIQARTKNTASLAWHTIAPWLFS